MHSDIRNRKRASGNIELVGVIGSIQAAEVIKIIVGLGEVLSGKLFVFNMLNCTSNLFTIKRNDKNFEVEELIDYEEFCKPTE